MNRLIKVGENHLVLELSYCDAADLARVLVQVLTGVGQEKHSVFSVVVDNVTRLSVCTNERQPGEPWPLLPHDAPTPDAKEK